MSVVVFLGPSLPLAAARAILPQARYAPPARLGDIYRCMRRERPRVIVLIDGVFHRSPSVWHRELLWAMSEGAIAIGAASMGALRAAELAAFGMRGAGRIFEAYRDGRFAPFDDAFEDDGEVAVAHAPPELGAAALTIALVDVRATLAAREITPARRDALLERARVVHFAERSTARLREAWHGEIDDAPLVAQKAEDALAALRLAATCAASDQAASPADFVLEPTLFWMRLRARIDAEEEARLPDGDELVLDELRLDPRRWQELRHAAAQRLAATVGTPDADELRAARARLRDSRGLADGVQLDAWLTRNAMAFDDLKRLARDDAAIAAFAATRSAELPRAMLDLLRLGDAFEALRRRADAKEAVLGRAPPPPPTPAQVTRLVAWFADRSGVPASAPALMRLLGCRDEGRLYALLARELAFVAAQTASRRAGGEE